MGITDVFVTFTSAELEDFGIVADKCDACWLVRIVVLLKECKKNNVPFDG